MNIREAIIMIRSKLSPLLGEYALPQAEQILESLLHISRTDLYLSGNRVLNSKFIDELNSIVQRRLTGEPLQYILGKVYFYSREFSVTKDVLIPRPDTEVLIEQVLSNEKQKRCLFADVGTGSGIISCILTEEKPDWTGIGIDISAEALKIAKSNRKTGNLHFLRADLLSSIKHLRIFDFLVSNPPYISEEDYKNLDASVRDFEPPQALYGGYDGLQFYRRLAIDSRRLLRSSSNIYCEIGYNQELMVKSIFKENGWKKIQVVKDLNNLPRVIIASYF